jgi:formylglycine-generating enzyme required for sulfatase activity
MSSLMAIISKGAFEELCAKGDLQPGQRTPLDRYLSANKALQPLADGGSLFLVTVRPPKESLWLVAILEAPVFKKDRWQSAPNEVSIVDITALSKKLCFETGKGLVAKPGLLGAALQSPRRLTKEDEALLRSVAGTSATSKTSTAPAIQTETPASASDVAHALSSLGNWQALATPARRQVLGEIARRLGTEFKVESTAVGRAKLGSLVHVPTNTEMLAIPGGTLTMGIGLDDAFQIARLVPKDELDELGVRWSAMSRPAHPVAVRPFLLARTHADLKTLCREDKPTVECIEATWKKLGMRLPSEAEWEWSAREGGATPFTSVPANSAASAKSVSALNMDFEENGWGVKGLLNQEEVVADRWHDTYEGAPKTSEPWLGDGPVGTFRDAHTSFQMDVEVAALHPGNRRGYGERFRCARIARDIPGLDFPPIDREVVAKSARLILTVLAKGSAKERGAAFWVLSQLRKDGLSYDEGAALLPGLLSLLKTSPEAELPGILQAIADCLVGGHPVWSRRRLGIQPVSAGHGEIRPELLAQVEPKALVRFLSHDSSLVRASAGLLAAVLGEKAALTRALEKEGEPLVKASLLLALGHAGDVDVLAGYLSDPQGIVAVSAAVAAVASGKTKDLSAEVLNGLVLGLSLSDMKEKEWPWFGADLQTELLSLFERAGDPAKAAAAMSLLKAAAKAEGSYGSVEVVERALGLLFKKTEERLEAAKLTAGQRAFLVAISTDGKLALPRTLSDYGIPKSLDTRRIWLGLDPKGAADREIETEWEGGARRWSILEWMEALQRKGVETGDHETKNRLVVEFFASLDPILRLELLLDWHRIDILLWENKELAPAKIWQAAAKADEARAKAVLVAAKDAGKGAKGVNPVIKKLLLLSRGKK